MLCRSCLDKRIASLAKTVVSTTQFVDKHCCRARPLLVLEPSVSIYLTHEKEEADMTSSCILMELEAEHTLICLQDRQLRRKVACTAIQEYGLQLETVVHSLQ